MALFHTIPSYISVTMLGVMFLSQTQAHFSFSPWAGTVLYNRILAGNCNKQINKSIIQSYVHNVVLFHTTPMVHCNYESQLHFCDNAGCYVSFPDPGTPLILQKIKHHSKLHTYCNVALFHTTPMVHLSSSPWAGTVYLKIGGKF